MAPRYRWRDELTRADVAFEATGDTPAEALLASWSALVEVLHPDPLPAPGIGEGPVRRRIIAAVGWEETLFELLEWVVYVKDAECLLLAPVAVDGEPAAVVAAAHEVRLGGAGGGTDVKAVTRHLFSLRRVAAGWTATVILDV